MFDVVTYALAKAYTDSHSSVAVKAWLGITTTTLTEGSSVNPIVVDGESVTAESGSIASYNNVEFIFNGATWQKFGGRLKDLIDVDESDPESGQILEYDGTKYVNGRKRTVISAVLKAGDSSVTVNNAAITNTAMITVFAENTYMEMENIEVSGTSVTVTFPEQGNDINIRVVVTE